MHAAWLYDGASAVRHCVTLDAAGPALEIRGAPDPELSLGPDELVHIESRADAELYGRKSLPGWRLGVPGPVPDEIAALLPARQVYGRWIDRIGLGKALAAGAVASAALLFLGHKAPALLAPLVPYSWEQSFGDALVGDLGGKFCAGPGGQEALDAMVAKLTPDPARYKVRVVNLPIVNAVALPGGNIVIFRELLAEAEGPDEVAGVLGHEIAHIDNRDVTRAMIREYGFGLLLASVGGTTGGNVDMLASASYSREAEAQADADSIAALRRANVSPRPTAGFFARLAKYEKGLDGWDDALGYVSSHPLSEGRRRRFEESAEAGRAYAPSLTEEQWAALADICHNDPNR